MIPEVQKEVRRFKITLYVWSFVILVVCVFSFILSWYLIRFGEDLIWWQERVTEVRDELNLLKEKVNTLEKQEM